MYDESDTQAVRVLPSTRRDWNRVSLFLMPCVYSSRRTQPGSHRWMRMLKFQPLSTGPRLELFWYTSSLCVASIRTQPSVPTPSSPCNQGSRDGNYIPSDHDEYSSMVPLSVLSPARRDWNRASLFLMLCVHSRALFTQNAPGVSLVDEDVYVPTPQRPNRKRVSLVHLSPLCGVHPHATLFAYPLVPLHSGIWGWELHPTGSVNEQTAPAPGRSRLQAARGSHG
jgi:hypothetical protein